MKLPFMVVFRGAAIGLAGLTYIWGLAGVAVTAFAGIPVTKLDSLADASDLHWGGVFRKGELLAARRKRPDCSVRRSVELAGIRMRKPRFEEYPFQFDHLLAGAEQVQLAGDWPRAAEIYEYMENHYG
ncbi:MAG TPA: hypothetical protein PKX94_09845, partial [Opitutales bacterium]|nr:hypothetical protein [Opitutales bacterium]